MLSSAPYVVIYRGFASGQRVVCNARLLQDANQYAGNGDGLLHNIKNVIRKVFSREIPFAQVRVDYNHTSAIVSSDEEGYVGIDWQTETPQHDVHAWNPIFISTRSKTFAGEIMVPSSKAKMAIVTDIDDTLLVTDVHSPLRMAVNSLLKNPFQRGAFQGMDAYFNQLDGGGINPVFYLSNSPWNLYKNIDQFLTIHNMPKGPILLRDYGLYLRKTPESYTHHKRLNLELLLNVYKDLKFVLIGDASQEDPYIYSHIRAKYPERIQSIRIRAVADKKKMEQLRTDPVVVEAGVEFFEGYL
jgi:phosphatidate phosphatase APP1